MVQESIEGELFVVGEEYGDDDGAQWSKLMMMVLGKYGGRKRGVGGFLFCHVLRESMQKEGKGQRVYHIRSARGALGLGFLFFVFLFFLFLVMDKRDWDEILGCWFNPQFMA